jgi:hypothetical protein
MGTINLRTTMLLAIATAVAVTSEPTNAAEVVGEQSRWTFEFRVRLEQADSQTPLEVDIDGEWVSTVCSVRLEGYDTRLQVTGTHIQGDGTSHAPSHTIEQVQQRLSRPFWATYANDGSLLRVHFFKDVNPSERNLLQVIATASQLVRPEPGRLGWTAMERDGAGSYLAIYNGSGPGTVVKRKLKYVATDGVAGIRPDGLDVVVDQSEVRFLLDANGRVTALDGSERVRVGVLLGNSVQVATITEIHLANLRKGRAPELIGSLARSFPAVESTPILTYRTDPEQIRKQRDDRLLEGRTTQALLTSAMARGYDSKLPDRLAALFRRRPEAVAAALTLLRKGDPQNQIIRALASAATGPSIQGLASLAHDRTAPSPLRHDAVTALVFIRHPSREAMHIPLSLLDDSDLGVESAARIVGGAMARAGRIEHPAEADMIDAALIARFRRAQEVPKLLDLLAALGNSVGISVLPVIGEALRDARAPVRAAAARGLRLSTELETDRMLAAAITTDDDPGVRTAAIIAAGFRHPLGPSLVDALRHAATMDAVEYVRSDAVTLLRQNPDASPQVLETLEWVAEHDSQPGVRRLAREAFASASGAHQRDERFQ